MFLGSLNTCPAQQQSQLQPRHRLSCLLPRGKRRKLKRLQWELEETIHGNPRARSLSIAWSGIDFLIERAIANERVIRPTGFEVCRRLRNV